MVIGSKRESVSAIDAWPSACSAIETLASARCSGSGADTVREPLHDESSATITIPTVTPIRLMSGATPRHDSGDGHGKETQRVAQSSSNEPSRRRRVSLRGRPPAYPVSLPPAPTMRWQGMTMGIGLEPSALPTARAAFGRSIRPAMSP